MFVFWCKIVICETEIDYVVDKHNQLCEFLEVVAS